MRDAKPVEAGERERRGWNTRGGGFEMAGKGFGQFGRFGMALCIAFGAIGSLSAFAATPATYVLTVDSKNPASGVAIAVTPADVNKLGNGETSFKRTYAVGETVTLTAPAKSGNNPFVSWSGCTSAGSVTCKVKLKANTTVTATYAQTYELKIDSTTPASGVPIMVAPADVRKASSGSTGLTRIYKKGTSIALTASSRSGNNPFVFWDGCTSTSGLTCKVTLEANTTVTAYYAQAYELKVESTGTSSGLAIGVSPLDNNNAGSGSTAFSRVYDRGTSITLTAPATSGSNSFVSWSGCTSFSAFTCTVALFANATVIANYGKVNVLTVHSTNPVSGVAIGVSPADFDSAGNGSTSFTRVYSPGTSVTLTAPAKAGNNPFVSWSGCASASAVNCTVTMNANTTVTANYAQTYVLTVNSTNPATGVTINVSPVDVNAAGNGSTSFTRIYDAEKVITLTAPAKSGSNNFVAWGGCSSTSTVTCTVTLNANTTVTAAYAGVTTPIVTVTPSSSTVVTVQPLPVKIAVIGPTGQPAPTGTVTLTSGTYTSAAATLSSGGVTLNISAGSLATGSDTLTATYAPDAGSSLLYKPATGKSAAVNVVTGSAVTVNQSSSGPAISDHLVGMDMAAWFDPTNPVIVPAFATAGIKSVRWPGGIWADDYHWATNSLCSGGSPNQNAVFGDFINSLVIPSGVDVALTANYGTNEACNGGGDPTEAAAWVANAKANGGNVSQITVGNESYGFWEPDMHAKPHDAATFASALATGYYPDIKAADPNMLVGMPVEPFYPPWDSIVMANAKYDFVEYHFYPQGPGTENDTFLVQKAAQELTDSVNTIKQELTTAGHADTPIYIGEIGSTYANPGKQTSSITQALFAGQMLGEMMNDGVEGAGWWLAFGGCSDASTGNFSSSLYGWQNFGGNMVFSDGTPEYGCENATPVAAGTLLPTARAFQLFSQMAITGEHVLTAGVAGDTTDVRAYAATNTGGTALLLFNVNETASESVVVTLSKQTASTGVTISTYSKAIYDQSKNNVWAAPTTTNLGAQSLPLTLMLDPWSMNVVIVR